MGDQDVVEAVTDPTALEGAGPWPRVEGGKGVDLDERAVGVDQGGKVGGRLAQDSRALVEIAHDHDVAFPRGHQVLHDGADPLGLAGAFGPATAGLALEVVHQHPHGRPAEQPALVLSAVAAEEMLARRTGVGDVDVTAYGDDLDLGAGQDVDVDAAGVVTVDQHDVAVLAGQQVGVEAVQRRAVLGFHHRLDVGGDVVDDLGGHAGAGLIDRLGGQLQPAGPAAPTGGDNLDAGVGVLDVEAAAVGPQPGPLGGGGAVAAHDPIGHPVDIQLDEQVDHAGLIGRAVGGLLDQGVEFGVGVQDGLALGPGGLVERSWSGDRFSTLNDANRTVIAYLLKVSKRTRSYRPRGQSNMPTEQSAGASHDPSWYSCRQGDVGSE